MGYNNRREVFPNNIVAGMFGFQPAALLEIEKPEKREAPKVQFVTSSSRATAMRPSLAEAPAP